MSAFLENYGAGEEGRSKFAKWAIIGVAALLVLGAVSYLYFRNFKEEHIAKQFLGELNARQFDAAYRTWGCTDAHPCRDYGYQKFLEDWGSQQAEGKWRVSGVDGCPTGAIVLVTAGRTEPTAIWVERGSTSLTFSPWNECQGKRWRFKQFFQQLFGK